MCAVLQERYRVQLYSDDFYTTDEDEKGTFRFANPLQIGQIANNTPLLVVHSWLMLDPKARKADLTFKVDPASVQFHLFEASTPPSRHISRIVQAHRHG
jgi:hypothetical protein